MSDVEKVKKSWVNNDFHLGIKMFFLSMAPEVSFSAIYGVYVAYDAYLIKFFNQLESIGRIQFWFERICQLPRIVI